ncbi:MAG: 50S ribosomal protein L29 [Flavobacteriales bacterium]|nr:50S ribosomal protein L29 [Flavobacteriales bacterium]
MKAKDIKDLNLEELKDKLNEKTAELAKMKITHAISPVENPMLIRANRRTVARLKTAIKQQEAKANNK